MVSLRPTQSDAVRVLHGPARRPKPRVKTNAQVTIALVVIVFFVLLSLLAPFVAPFDPNAADGSIKYLPPGSPGHVLGTDEQGRDVLSRLIWGGRTSLLIAFISVTLSTIFGSTLALLAGFSGERISGIIMRSIDVMFAFPVIIVAVALAVILGPGTPVVIAAIIFASIPYVTRVIFAEVKLQCGREYVEASISLGAGFFSILFREVLPNVIGQILVYGTGLVGGMIVFSSSLSALGIGVQPPTADWGRMISEGAKVIISGNIFVALFPGLTVLAVALAFNWLGDGLRDVFDPNKKRIRA